MEYEATGEALQKLAQSKSGWALHMAKHTLVWERRVFTAVLDAKL